MVINQYSNWTALKILINCRSWHLLTQCHILISLVLHHLMAKVGNSQRKSEIRWLVRRWHVMTCSCFPHEPTKVFGSTNKQFSLSMLLLGHLEIEICDYSWRTSLSFTTWRKKTTQKPKVGWFKPWWSDFPHSSQLRPWSFTVIIPLSLRQVSRSKKWQQNRRCHCFIFVFGTCGFNKKVRAPPESPVFLDPQKTISHLVHGAELFLFLTDFLANRQTYNTHIQWQAEWQPKSIFY